MFAFLLGLTIYVGSVGQGSAISQPASTAPFITNPQQRSRPQRLERIANNFPGADLGAKINAADKDLGDRAGEILVHGGGMISTQVTINSGHTLRFGPGIYRLATRLLWEGGLLLKSRTTVVGSGWDTIIVEPPETGWIVFQSYDDIRGTPAHSGTDSEIHISNLQIRGANPAVEGSVRQTINLGNCHNCSVERVWFNETSVIGVAAGGNALKGNHADTVVIRNNLFTKVAGQAAAVVNGRNVVIDRNTFKDSGRNNGLQGVTAIDIEPNSPADIAQHIEITNNLVDSRGSGFLHGNAILVQNGVGTHDFGPVLVKGNIVIGGELIPNSSGNVATGIYIAATQDVTVIGNTIRRVAHSGIRLENTTRSYVANNTLVSTATGGILAFEVINTTDSRIFDNVVTVDPKSPLANSVIKQTGNSRNNLYRGNTNGRAPLAPIILNR